MNWNRAGGGTCDLCRVNANSAGTQSPVGCGPHVVAVWSAACRNHLTAAAQPPRPVHQRRRPVDRCSRLCLARRAVEVDRPYADSVSIRAKTPDPARPDVHSEPSRGDAGDFRQPSASSASSKGWLTSRRRREESKR
jgi:hypothetical protein